MFIRETYLERKDEARRIAFTGLKDAFQASLRIMETFAAFRQMSGDQGREGYRAVVSDCNGKCDVAKHDWWMAANALYAAAGFVTTTNLLVPDSLRHTLEKGEAESFQMLALAAHHALQFVIHDGCILNQKNQMAAYVAAQTAALTAVGLFNPEVAASWSAEGRAFPKDEELLQVLAELK